MKGWVIVVWLGFVVVLAAAWGFGGYLAYQILT